MTDNNGKIIKDKNAVDFIQEWAASRPEVWIQPLVSKIIEIGQLPPENFLDQVYLDFCKENELLTGRSKTEKNLVIPSSSGNAKTSPESTSRFIKLNRLKHIHGANALKDGEELVFHPNLTLVFGHNGAGKSGYIRILKRICGSPSIEDIWSNVRIERTTNQCKAEIEIEVDSKVTSIVWSGNNFGVFPFTNIAIFDGKSIPFYLTGRRDFTYQPFRIELFGILSECFTKLKEQLERDIELKTVGISDPLSSLSPTTKLYQLVMDALQDGNYPELIKLAVWHKKDEVYLGKKIKGRGKVEDLSDKLELEQQRLSQVDDLIQNYTLIGSTLASEKIKKFQALEVKQQKLKGEIKKLNDSLFSNQNIKGVNTDEWRDFILKSEEYIQSISSKYPQSGDRCVYCQQLLTKPSIELVKQYHKAVLLWTGDELTSVKSDIDGFVDEISSLEIYQINSSDTVKKVLGKKLLDQITRVGTAIVSHQTDIEDENYIRLSSLSTKSLVNSLRKIKDRLEQQQEQLLLDQQNHEAIVSLLDTEIAELECRRELHRLNKQLSKDWITSKWLGKAQSALNKLNTRPITDLSKNVWQALVSDHFIQAFKQEAKNLEAPEIDISFPADYGVPKQEKSFAGCKNIDALLSESEQRAIAMSDFLAEAQLKNVVAPLIFDDPVNSFDEGRRQILAQRLFEESQNRQVIIFTHDVLFASNLFDYVVNKKDPSKIDTNFAYFHWIEGNGKEAGLVSKDSCPRMDGLDRNLNDAKFQIPRINVLHGSDKEEAIFKAYTSLRKSLECLVIEKLFGGVVKRWREQVQMMSLDRVITDPQKYSTAKNLFEEFSKYGEAHIHSPEVMQNFPNATKLENDIARVETLLH